MAGVEGEDLFSQFVSTFCNILLSYPGKGGEGNVRVTSELKNVASFSPCCVARDSAVGGSAVLLGSWGRAHP